MRPETLQEQLFFTTVQIETVAPDGATGSGTGFMYSVSIDAEREVTFLVTNKHVVAGARFVNLRFVLQDESDPAVADLLAPHFVTADAHDWFTGHAEAEIDIAVAPLSGILNGVSAAGRPPFYRALTPDIVMNSAKATELDALEPVTFIGYPNGLYDRVNNLPIARRGNTATPPAIDYL